MKWRTEYVKIGKKPAGGKKARVCIATASTDELFMDVRSTLDPNLGSIDGLFGSSRTLVESTVRMTHEEAKKLAALLLDLTDGG